MSANTNKFKPCLVIDKNQIPFYNSMTIEERAIAEKLKKIAYRSSNKSEKTAKKYYDIVSSKYNDLAVTRFFKSYVYKINEKYDLNLELPKIIE